MIHSRLERPLNILAPLYTGFSDKPLSRTRLLQKLYEFVFQILFLSGHVFGLVFSRRACYRLVPGFSIPAYSLGIGVECPVREIVGLKSRSGLTMGDFTVRTSP